MTAVAPREKIVSIGGWCGVAAVLRKQTGLCREAYPFDYILSSFAGVIHFLTNGFDDFFPENPTPRLEDGFTKFFARHTIFLHHDLRQPDIVAAFKRRIRRFLDMLAQETEPVLFVRASGAHFDEAHLIPDFVAVIRKRFPALHFRLLFLSHYQGDRFETGDPDVILRYLDRGEFQEEEYLKHVGDALGWDGDGARSGAATVANYRCKWSAAEFASE